LLDRCFRQNVIPACGGGGGYVKSANEFSSRRIPRWTTLVDKSNAMKKKALRHARPRARSRVSKYLDPDIRVVSTASIRNAGVCTGVHEAFRISVVDACQMSGEAAARDMLYVAVAGEAQQLSRRSR